MVSKSETCCNPSLSKSVRELSARIIEKLLRTLSTPDNLTSFGSVKEVELLNGKNFARGIMSRNRLKYVSKAFCNNGIPTVLAVNNATVAGVIIFAFGTVKLRGQTCSICASLRSLCGSSLLFKRSSMFPELS